MSNCEDFSFRGIFLKYGVACTYDWHSHLSHPTLNLLQSTRYCLAQLWRSSLQPSSSSSFLAPPLPPALQQPHTPPRPSSASSS